MQSKEIVPWGGPPSTNPPLDFMNQIGSPHLNFINQKGVSDSRIHQPKGPYDYFICDKKDWKKCSIIKWMHKISFFLKIKKTSFARKNFFVRSELFLCILITYLFFSCQYFFSIFFIKKKDLINLNFWIKLIILIWVTITNFI